jgi:hypothetical protein
MHIMLWCDTDRVVRCVSYALIISYIVVVSFNRWKNIQVRIIVWVCGAPPGGKYLPLSPLDF